MKLVPHGGAVYYERKAAVIMTELKRSTYTVQLEEPELYVDNESRGRSGHMTHAMAQYKPGCFIDFNSNCSGVRWNGHSPYGWIEYRISEDAGKTYSDVSVLPYSVECFKDGIHAISVEKAVACDTGRIVAFCLRNDATGPTACEPWDTPTYITSDDGGKTWSQAREFIPYQGRIYDALYHNGVIYVLIFCNKNFIGTTPEHVYRIYKSADNGESFEELCVVPIDGIGRGYGSILIDDDNVLHAYGYNVNAETEMDHAISRDFGKTWTLLKPCYLKEGIRNPQTAQIDGVYVAHGRAGDVKGFILYTSLDSANWDEGHYIHWKPGGACYYSNNLNLRDENGNFLLIQYSDAYRSCCVNVRHIRLRIKK